MLMSHRDHLLKTVSVGLCSRTKMSKFGGMILKQVLMGLESVLRGSESGMRNGRTFASGSSTNTAARKRAVVRKRAADD